MKSIVYSSRATAEMTSEALSSILETSRRNNERLGITGLMLYRRRRFFQLMEGPAADIDERLEVIERDSRHEQLHVHLSYDVERRQFPAWSMGFDAVSDDAARSLPGYRSSISDLFTAPVDRYDPFLPALHELMRWYQDAASVGVGGAPRGGDAPGR
ncbi:BLUF domain-containing protein [Homoserinibacter sp. YIM 151385]|uniref:BLUF domain-containing protein n=1 Tax=Homoserinibacter sp. YIM 151385 TaxID=2985506 RepID=UPI0022F10BFF|nr:BLUF domain-containing protein [Homoserinibacter sp. YIM 151385]WBU37528.1 BLUF domain-containing protein [Homoserinibacter sp. YIM 151385]